MNITLFKKCCPAELVVLKPNSSKKSSIERKISYDLSSQTRIFQLYGQPQKVDIFHTEHKWLKVLKFFVT